MIAEISLLGVINFAFGRGTELARH